MTKTPTRHRPPTRADRKRKEEAKARAAKHKAALKKSTDKIIGDIAEDLLASDPKKARTSSGPRRKSLAHRAAAKVGRKHPGRRVATYVAVGSGVILGRGLKYTGIGAAKAGRHVGRKIGHKVRADARYRKWTPLPTKEEGQRWWTRTVSVTCICGKQCSSTERLSRHMAEDHRGEPRSFAASRPKIHRGHTARTAGKVIVRPKVAGGGRHRARHNLPGARRVSDLVEAYGPHIALIRKRIDTMADDVLPALSSIRRASADLAATPRPRKLSEFRAQAIALEQGFAVLADGVEKYALMMAKSKDSGGGNVDRDVMGPFIREIDEALAAASMACTRLIVRFEIEYNARIRADNDGREAPAMDLAS